MADGRRPPAKPGLGQCLSDQVEVDRHEIDPLAIGQIEPAPDRFAGEAAVRERADEATARTEHPVHLGEYVEGAGEVVDGDAADDIVERAIGEREVGVAIEVMHDSFGRRRVGLQFLGVHAEYGQALRRILEVRNPRRHQVEHVTLHLEFAVEGADAGDRSVVDMGDEPCRLVELGIVVLVEPGEESWRKSGIGRRQPNPSVGAHAPPAR